MNLTINFHQLEPTDSIKDMVRKKSEKLQKYFDHEFALKWTVSVGKEGHHSHALLSCDGASFNADSVKDDLYKTFDDVVSKLEKQLTKKKSMAKDHIHNKKFDLHQEMEMEEEEEL